MPITGIAQQLGPSVHAVERRLRPVYDKLGVSDRRDLRAAAPPASAFIDVPAAITEARSRLQTLLNPRGVLEVDIEIDDFEALDAVIVLKARSDRERDQASGGNWFRLVVDFGRERPAHR